MFHQGFTKQKAAIVRGGQHPIVVSKQSRTGKVKIEVDPWLLLDAIEAHFHDYVTQLRDPSQTTLRANFERWFNLRGS